MGWTFDRRDMFWAAVLYVGSRIFAPAEEASLAATFGARWDDYCSRVKMPWL